jgi:putative ABC transport system ATP-binding protein
MLAPMPMSSTCMTVRCGVGVRAARALRVLELRDLRKHYRVGGGEPIHAVDGVSMTIAAGEFVALYGPSGSGKTTLLELIAGIRRPDGGTVLVGGRDVCSMSESEGDEYRLRQLGVIGQPQHLIPGARAIENASLKLLLTSKRTAKHAIEPLLEQLGLGERLSHRTEQLSMGERQRVMIARALALDPELVLADEPTGSLDTQRTREVLGLLRELCRERRAAVLLATHDPQAAMFADRVCELRDGRLGHYTPDHAPALSSGGWSPA